jgi:hypothetical protein
MRRGGGGNMVEKRRAARKNLEADSLGLEPLQALEIPQNGQSFVWKCLDENTPDLEKLAKTACRPAFIPPPARGYG